MELSNIEVFRQKAPQIMRDLMNDIGWNEIAAAGVLGNIGGETDGFRIKQQVGGNGFGWCQWDDRRNKLFAYCRARGIDLRGSEEEYDRGCYAFLVHELTETDEKRVVPLLDKAKTIKSATEIFCKKFERAGKPHMEKRKAYAREALEAYKLMYGDKQDVEEAKQMAKDDIGTVISEAGSNQPAPPWVAEGMKLKGLKEIVGSRHEAQILKFFAEAGHPEIHDDETAWCAAFVNAMLRRAGYKGTQKLNARSFMSWGVSVPVDKPRYGAIAVFWRGDPNGWSGHVGFYVGETKTHIKVLGGNQSNSVSISLVSKKQLLGLRWPKGAAEVATQKPPLVDDKVVKKEVKKQDSWIAAVISAIGLALLGAYNWLTEHLLAVTLGLLVVAIVAFVVVYYFKRRQSWSSISIGDHSQEQSPKWLRNLDKSLEPDSGQPVDHLEKWLDQVSEGLRVAPSQPSSVSKRRRKKSATQSATIRKRQRSSKNSKRSVAQNSRRKQKRGSKKRAS